MVIETGTDERAPIILGRPFLNTSRAIIYASATEINFYIKGKKETFLQEQDYTNFRAIPTMNQGRGPTGRTGNIGEDEYDPPTILGRPILNTIKAIIYIGTGEVHMHFPSVKVHRYFTDLNYIVEDSKQVRTRRRRRNHNQRRQIIKDG